MNLQDKTVEQLIQLFTVAQAQIETQFLAACRILVELRRRGRSRPEWSEGIWAWKDAVVKGEASPRMVLLLARAPIMIHGLLPLPVAQQERLVDGEKITVAVLGANNEVVAEEQTLATIQQSTFMRVFTDSGMRDFEAQKRVLLDRGAVRRSHRSNNHTTVRVDKKTDELIVGQVRVRAVDAVSALMKLGYRVERLATT